MDRVQGDRCRTQAVRTAIGAPRKGGSFEAVTGRAARRGGFTLIEVVLAVGLFALGATALLGLFSAGAGMASGASLRAEAAASLERIAADLEERLFPILPDGTLGAPLEPVDRPVPGQPRLTYTARVVPDPDPPPVPGLPGLVRVDVEVRWKERGNRLALETSLLLHRAVPYGERLRRRFVPGADLALPEDPETE